MLARGALGNPWLFRELLGRRRAPAEPGEVLGELELDDRARRSSTSAAARGALPTQVLPLVHRAPGARPRHARPSRRLRSAAGASRALATLSPERRRLSARRALLSPRPTRGPAGPRYTAAPLTGSAADEPRSQSGVLRPGRGRNRHASEARHAERRHPHPRRSPEAQGRARPALDREASRGRRTDQGGPGVRRHRRELRVRRRQERAGDAREPHRPAAGEAADGDA